MSTAPGQPAIDLSYDSERLIRNWRDRYTGRRSVAHQMLTDAEVLVRDAVDLEVTLYEKRAVAERAYDLERRERAVEWAERSAEHEKDRLRRQLAEAKAEIATLHPRYTQAREERETVEDGVVVRIHAPQIPAYGDKTKPRPWTLGELDQVTYRLRMAGADDSTEVRFDRDHVEACVPFPEYALEAPAIETALVVAPQRQRLISVATAMRASALLLLILAVALLVAVRP